MSNKRLSMQHNIDFAISMDSPLQSRYRCCMQCCTRDLNGTEAEIVEVSMGDYKGVADILEQKKNIFMGNR